MALLLLVLFCLSDFCLTFFLHPGSISVFTFYYGTPASYDTRYFQVWNKLPKYSYLMGSYIYGPGTHSGVPDNKTWKLKYQKDKSLKLERQKKKDKQILILIVSRIAHNQQFVLNIHTIVNAERFSWNVKHLTRHARQGRRNMSSQTTQTKMI